MKRITLIIVLTLLSTAALACMGVLVNTQIVAGGALCTYRLSNGQNVQVMYPNQYSCQFCM